MGNIRINLLARELEIKSHLILEYLTELGVEKKSHSSALDDDIADKVREHFRAVGEAEQVAEEAPAPRPAPVVSKEAPAAVVEPRKLPDIIKAELQHPLTRSLEEIKSAARKVVIPPARGARVSETIAQPVAAVLKPTPVLKPVPSHLVPLPPVPAAAPGAADRKSAPTSPGTPGRKRSAS